MAGQISTYFASKCLDHLDFHIKCGRTDFRGGLPAGGRRLQKIILCLSHVFKQKISFDDVFANIPEILKKLNRQKVGYSITNFSVKNFRPQVGITGKFYAAVNDSHIARKIIRDYEGDVIDVQLEIAKEEPSYWYISASGKVVVKSPDRDTLLSDSDLVKSLLTEK